MTTNDNEQLKAVIAHLVREEIRSPTAQNLDRSSIVNFVMATVLNEESNERRNETKSDVDRLVQESFALEKAVQAMQGVRSPHHAFIFNQGMKRSREDENSPPINGNSLDTTPVKHEFDVGRAGLTLSTPIRPNPGFAGAMISPSKVPIVDGPSKVRIEDIVDLTNSDDDEEDKKMSPVQLALFQSRKEENGNETTIKQENAVLATPRQQPLTRRKSVGGNSRGHAKSNDLDNMLRANGFPEPKFSERHGERLGFVGYHSDFDHLPHHKNVINYMETAFGVPNTALETMPMDLSWREWDFFFRNHKYLERLECNRNDLPLDSIIRGRLTTNKQKNYCKDHPFLVLIILECSGSKGTKKRIAVVYHMKGRIIFPGHKKDKHWYEVGDGTIDTLKKNPDVALNNIFQLIRKVKNHNFPNVPTLIRSHLVKKRTAVNRAEV